MAIVCSCSCNSTKIEDLEVNSCEEILGIITCKKIEQIDSSSFEIYYTVDGVVEGPSVILNIDSNVIVEQYYRNNQRDGHYSQFYSEGGLKVTGDFKKGLKVGLWKQFYENGNLSMTYNYNSLGVESGVVKEYYPNGELDKSYYLKGGQIVGDMLIYKEGYLKAQIKYSDSGSKEIEYHFSPNGDTLGVVSYFDGDTVVIEDNFGPI